MGSAPKRAGLRRGGQFSLDEYGVWGEKRFMSMLITNRSHFVIGPDGKLEDVQIGVSPMDSVRLAVGAIRG